jgi:hypothetical protein
VYGPVPEPIAAALKFAPLGKTLSSAMLVLLPLKVTPVSPSQEEKASAPILVTPDGMVMLTRAEQPEKA